jgi:putative acetyltransferase
MPQQGWPERPGEAQPVTEMKVRRISKAQTKAAAGAPLPRYPDAVDPGLVGSYPALAHAGGGYVWDDVLEYRVWCHPERGARDLNDGSDYYRAFATYQQALAFSEATKGAEAPLALIRQAEYIDEPKPGDFRHVKKPRITEWPVEFLRRPRRQPNTISDFLSPNAPANRLDIIRGLAK